MARKTKKYESLPFSIHLPLKPVDGKIDFRGKSPKIRAKKFQTTPTTIEATISNVTAIGRRYQERYAKGDASALTELVRLNPRFFRLDWVQEALYIGITKGKVPLIRQGRKLGSGLYSATFIQSMVESHTLKTSSSKESAFHFLHDMRIGLTYERIRELYYEAKKDSRNIALGFQDGPAYASDASGNPLNPSGSQPLKRRPSKSH